MREFAEKYSGNKYVAFMDAFFHSPYFSAITAVVVTLGAVFGLELLTAWYMCLCGLAVTLCCKDVSPIFCLFIFMNVMISRAHSPSVHVQSQYIEDPDYLLSPAVLSQLIICAALLVVGMAYRIVFSIIERRFKFNAIFFSLAAFCVAMCFNGIFSTGYYYMNIVYALGLGAILMVSYMFLAGNVHLKMREYKGVAYSLVALCASLLVQLIVAYFECNVIHDGYIDRSVLHYGWGTYNYFGLMICLCVPAWFYLATKYKYGYLFLLGAAANIIIALFGMSRQGILVCAVIAVACTVWYMIVGGKRDRIAGGALIGACLIALGIFAAVRWDWLKEFFVRLGDSFETGSGRTDLWEQGFNNWLHHPLFGDGFYNRLAADSWTIGYFSDSLATSIPWMCHNTIFELMSAGGTAGLGTYLIHRIITIKSLFKNLREGRVPLALVGAALLLASLLDNHFFYFLPTLVYGALLGMFSASEKEEEEVVLSVEEGEKLSSHLAENGQNAA